jgi:hypothetical protein
MQAPDIQLRRDLALQAAQAQSEEAVEDLLAQIEDRAVTEASTDDADQSPHALLAAVEAWASLASHIVARFYAPSSPRRDKVLGWSQTAVQRLRNIADGLRQKLEQVRNRLGARGFSSSVNYPWGISISLTW